MAGQIVGIGTGEDMCLVKTIESSYSEANAAYLWDRVSKLEDEMGEGQGSLRYQQFVPSQV